MALLGLLVGALDNLLRFPFQGPLHNTILSLMEDENMDEVTWSQVQQVLDLRMTQINSLMVEAFAGELTALQNVVTGE